MITPLLKLALEPVVRRHRLVRTLWWSAVLLALLAAGAWAWTATGHRLPIPVLVVLAYLLGWRLPTILANRWTPDYLRIARDIEQRHPALHTVLLTAVEQRPDPQTGKLHFLQQRVLADALAQARAHNWIDSVPPSRVFAGWSAVALAITALIFAHKPSTPARGKARQVAAATPTKDAVEVTPGDTSVERGTGLVVLATFGKNVPSEATLVVQTPNQPVLRIPLMKNLDDPVFGGGIPEVDTGFTYRVEYGGESTRDFKVTVFEHPRLERADATMHFPSYTGQPDKTVPDTRRISAVEGSTLDLALQLNKPVKSAELVSKDGETIPLEVVPDQPIAHLRGFPIASSHTYEVRLRDSDGRTNKIPAQMIIDALANKRPELKLVTPRGDVRVSPLEEVNFRVEAWDDFGLARYGLTYTVAGQASKDVEFGRATKADERLQAEHMLKLEALGLKPDELISYFAWAEDTGPDGKSRRTATDMFFAEVRPFEEIYRPGDGSESQQPQQGGAGEATKLAELQKQIISATWNLKRADEANTSGEKPDAKYREDEPVIRDSQGEALKQAGALAQKAEEPKSQALLEDVVREMQRALEHLDAAAKTSTPLPDALTAEQAAYNALLKLAAHEFRIVRNQRSRGREGGRQQRQAQLDELEMKEETKRYENKSEAETQQNEQQREQLAILNRLKELAQRQQDINERLKELQNALQAAKTDEQKEDIRRQLKRLREEEQQLLSDLDETRQKMEQSSQQSQLAEERKQLEQTRSEAQQASEAMERNAATQALASGTRAARQLQQMRDEFRKKTSGQFNDDMRQMRSDARALADKQQEIAEKLASEPEKSERRTLDGSSEREQLAQQFDQQRDALEKLTGEMKRVSEQAEAAEPLLARELYDALRKTAQSDTTQTLEMTKALNQRGFKGEAKQFEQKARKEIDELKSGVERAAESVLGNEAEALRQARAELDALSRELNREVSQARPDLAESDPAGRSSSQGEQRKDAQSTGDRQAANKAADGKHADGGRPKDAQPSGNPQPTASSDPQSGKADPGHEQTKGGEQPGGQQPGQQASQHQPGQPGAQSQNGKQAALKPGNTQAPGQQAQSSAQGGEQSSGSDSDASQPRGNGERSRLGDMTNRARQRAGARKETGRGVFGGATDGEQAGPLTGERFVEWSDRLRNVEEMLDSPELRRDAAQVREVARGVRAEFKRHSVAPNWEMVKIKISSPLAELRNRVTEELARRESRESLVPIDRDPVPAQFAERVRRYYEELGKSR